MWEPFLLIDDILDRYRAALADDFSAYRNHCQRVAHLCLSLAKPDPAAAGKIAVAAAFHDLGIWTDGTLDYLAPSRRLACLWLDAQGRKDWCDDVEAMIEQHHRIGSYPGGGLVEMFRRADAIDLSRGWLRWSLQKATVAALRARYPNNGFHRRLLQLGAKHLVTHPFDPLPMVRLGGAKHG